MGTLVKTRLMFRARQRLDFEDSVRPHLEVMYRVAKRLTRNDDDAADIVGQALYLACRAWHTFEGDNLRPWLLRILKNEFLGNQRKKGIRPKEVELSADLEVSDEHLGWTTIAANLESKRILAELDQLPEEFRLVLVLCDVEQLSYEEAAATLQIPLGTVRSRLFRARNRLRDRLSDSAENLAMEAN